MIIYGSRMYGKKNQVVSHGRCEHCGKYGRLESYDGRKWGHLYFIPLIPSGGPARVVRECKACNMGSHIPQENLPKILENLRQNIDRAVVAIGAQETHFDVDGQPVPATAAIINSIEDFYCLAGEDEVSAIMANLQVAEAHHHVRITEAKLHEIQGNRTSADSLYGELFTGNDDPVLVMHYAQYMFDTGRLEQARVAAEQLDQIDPHSLTIKQLLIDCYQGLGEWRKAVDVYEYCFELAPEIRENKNIYKAYKKACKKAGVTPQKRK